MAERRRNLTGRSSDLETERDRYKLQRDELLEAVRTFVQDTGKYDGALAEAAKRIEAENA